MSTQPCPDKGAEAERAAFEAWHRSKFATKHCTGQPTRDMHNGIYAEKYGPENQQLMWEAWRAAIAADRKAQAAAVQQPVAPIYQVQYYSEKGTSVWHDASEAAYHTFMPERRRIVYAAPAPGNTAQPAPHALDDDKKGGAK